MHKARLQVIPGGREGRQIGPVTLYAATTDRPPFLPEVQVLEDDTWRLVSAPVELCLQPQHPVRTATDLLHDRPARPGSLLVGRRGWHAVVYDLDRDPICREEWVAKALRRVIARAGRRGYGSVALPLLGCTHGDLTARRCLALLLAALREHAQGAGPYPQRLWLQVAPEQLGAVSALLHSLD